MKKPALTFIALAAAVLGGFVMNSAQTNADSKDAKVLRHVVLFKFKDDLGEAKVNEVVKAFAALEGKIEQIKDFEWGTDVSVENKADGFTHGFVVTFASKAGRDEYLPHPAHKEFVTLVGPRLDKVLVFDYWTGG